MSVTNPAEIVALIARHQTRLRGLVRCLFVPASDVDDVLQEINTVLWEKSAEFQAGTDFWAWGRDQQGAVWMTLGDRQAVRVHPDEMGLPLRYIGDLYTLNLETLLQSFLRYCRLELSDEADEMAGIRLITATPRRPWSDRPLRRAVIEVDRESGAIRRMVLERELERTTSVTTFTLVESRAADSSLYGPLGHLLPSGRMFGTEIGIEERRELMVNWFGSRAEQWLRIPEARRAEQR